MNTRTIQGGLLGLLLCGLTIARALPDGESDAAFSQDDRVADSRPAAVARHVVKRGGAVWFGRSRSEILEYAAVKTRAGSVTSDHRSKRQYNEVTSRYKLSIDIDAADDGTARVEAKVVEIERYTESNSFLDILVEAKTGVEGSSIGALSSERTLSAKIVTSYDADSEWTLSLDTEVDAENSSWRRHGSLVSADRSIEIVDKTDSRKSLWPSAHGVEFFEAGRWLGAIGSDDYVVYEFRKDLDPELKLVLAAAMEAIGFRLAGY